MKTKVETTVKAPIDQQRDGCQAIMNNFARHVEGR